jgi:tetratricopeptide (TPR) repeat protein
VIAARQAATRASPALAATLRRVADALDGWPDDQDSVHPSLPELTEALGEEAEGRWARSLRLLYLAPLVGLAEELQQLHSPQRRQAIPLVFQACQEAIEIAADLEDAPCLAMHWYMLARTCLFVGDRPEARRAYQQAQDIYKRLAAEQPRAYEPDLAKTLNNLGAVLSDLRELAEARRAFQQAQDLYARLAAEQPQAHAAELARALVNRARVEEELGQPEAALADCQAAEQGAERSALSLDAADVLDRAGRFYLRCHQEEEAARALAGALERGEGAVLALSGGEDTHLNLHKARFETAYAYGAYRAARRNGQAESHLFHLLETLRRVQRWALETGQEAPWGAVEGPRPAELPPERVAEIAGRYQAAMLRQREQGRASLQHQRAALLYVQPTPRSVVFHLLGPDGQTGTALAPLAFGRRMASLFLLLHRLPRFQARSPAVHVVRAAPDVSACRHRLAEEGRHAWGLLPAAVQGWFQDHGPHLWLSPHGEANRWPFEYLHPPAGPLGLSCPLPRAAGLGPLCEALERRPAPGRSLIVGEPARDGVAPLPAALRSAGEVRDLLAGVAPTQEVVCLCREQATREAVLHHLGAPELAFFLFTGHGGTGPRGAEVLLAAQADDEGRLDGVALHEAVAGAAGAWRCRPFVHLDCCHGGAELYRGGGKQEGLTYAALACGASAVLASHHSVGDHDAAEFAGVFYRAWLQDQKTAALALLGARRALYEHFRHDAVLWGLPVLHGNARVQAPW